MKLEDFIKLIINLHEIFSRIYINVRRNNAMSLA